MTEEEILKEKIGDDDDDDDDGDDLDEDKEEVDLEKVDKSKWACCYVSPGHAFHIWNILWYFCILQLCKQKEN